jgi:hypothetical protein
MFGRRWIFSFRCLSFVCNDGEGDIVDGGGEGGGVALSWENMSDCRGSQGSRIVGLEGVPPRGVGLCGLGK